MTVDLDRVTWPTPRLGEAIEALATWADLAPRLAELPPLQVDPADHHALDAWIERAADWLGVEAESVDAPWPAVGELLARAAPALLALPATESYPLRWVLLVAPAKGSGARRRVAALGPDRRVDEVAVEPLRAALCDLVETPVRAPMRALLTRAGVPPERFARAERELLGQRLGSERVAGCWLLRLDPGAALGRQFRHAGIYRRLARTAASQAALYTLGGLAWYIIGRGALQGTLEGPWLAGWALAVLTMIPLQLLASWHTGYVALEAGALFKQRLLAGALRLDPSVVRHEGAGSMLGRVIESSAVEAGALSGAVTSVAAAPELVLAAMLLAAGAGGLAHALLFVAWAAVGGAFAWRYARARSAWTVARVALTNDLVERMAGHRTRLAQQPPERWHEGEDRSLERYLTSSAELDRAQAWLSVIVPRGWSVVGVAALAPAVIAETATPTALAVGIAGVVLAGHALKLVTAGLPGVIGAGVAWREVGPLFRAAAHREAAGELLPPRRADAATEATAVLEAHDLVFAHEGRGAPVLRGVSLRINAGDRVLLEGPSGGGKSTLGALLAGLRSPSAGLLLLGGLDGRTVGSVAWRRRVVTSPQFHENHVMTGTMAFNLLMGRRWPPNDADLVEAEAVCRELDLGPLLERMPAGLLQMVGESGWRLSHGEQSRLFLARALLQGAEVVVLDESFGALDPVTLDKALACALRRCPALVVIAHP